MQRYFVTLLFLLTACGRPAPRAAVGHDSTEQAFAHMQTRGRTAMGVDQYTSMHRFEPTADGGRISLQRDPGDTAGVAEIRAHMRTIAQAFARGDFDIPGFVHDREVPGSSAMAALRSRITYVADTLPGGGQVRITSADPDARAAIHSFLAFQRREHRVGEGASH